MLNNFACNLSTFICTAHPSSSPSTPVSKKRKTVTLTDTNDKGEQVNIDVEKDQKAHKYVALITLWASGILPIMAMLSEMMHGILLFILLIKYSNKWLRRRSSLLRRRSSLLRRRSSLLRHRSSLLRSRSSLLQSRSSLLRSRSMLIQYHTSILGVLYCVSCFIVHYI
jgi:hypothetical protein